MPRIDHFRQQATECLALSERCPAPRHKQLFLRIAQSWLSLVEQDPEPQSHVAAAEAERPDRS
jgi:hypothetical protein